MRAQKKHVAERNWNHLETTRWSATRELGYKMARNLISLSILHYEGTVCYSETFPARWRNWRL